MLLERQGIMFRLKWYSLDQEYLLLLNVRDELMSNIFAFSSVYGLGSEFAPILSGLFGRGLVTWFAGEDLSEQLFSYALGSASVRQVEWRLIEDLAFRELTTSERINSLALRICRRQHGAALKCGITQVLARTGQRRIVKLGRVVIDSMHVSAMTSCDRGHTEWTVIGAWLCAISRRSDSRLPSTMARSRML
jgi:hypothetical protein